MFAGALQQARALGFQVLLDTAAFVSSHPLSLRDCPADFAVLSFYKLFGYPTGLGALVMRRDAMPRLRRPWFAGGTVRYASVQAGVHRLHDGAEGFAFAAGVVVAHPLGPGECGAADELGFRLLPSEKIIPKF